MPNVAANGLAAADQPWSTEALDELCATTIRAMSQDADLCFRHHLLHRGQTPLPLNAPHLHPPATDTDFQSRRGAADAMAWRITFSDANLHAALLPEDPVAALVFEMLEQYRVESLGADELPGSRANLTRRFLAWSGECETAGLLETAHGLLVFYVAQVGRSRVTGDPVPDDYGDLLESTRGGLADTIGPEFAKLRRVRDSQIEYSVPALAIANAIGDLLATGSNLTQQDAGASVRARIPGLIDLKPAAKDASGAEIATGANNGAHATAPRPAYQAFTTKYDQTLPISAVVTPRSAQTYRTQLDEIAAKHRHEVSRLTRALRTSFAQPKFDSWEGGHDEGILDGRRLSQLITAPTNHRIFRQLTAVPTPQASVTFLIDCSGSMKKYREHVALLVDIFARALDLADIECEILGFTTGAWNGGRARTDWVRAGRPAHPGRLNEAWHLVIKDAETSWRRARNGIASLLSTNIYREGIDGEAVTWAYRRLAERECDNRILLVISDGSPMDSATNLVNDDEYINRDLFNVVSSIEKAGLVQLSALYLAAELPACFRRAHLLDPAQLSDSKAIRATLDLMSNHHNRF